MSLQHHTVRKCDWDIRTHIQQTNSGVISGAPLQLPEIARAGRDTVKGSVMVRELSDPLLHCVTLNKSPASGFSSVKRNGNSIS